MASAARASDNLNDRRTSHLPECIAGKRRVAGKHLQMRLDQPQLLADQ
jgi:hypothetical protein